MGQFGDLEKKKQSVVAHKNAEAEYRVIVQGICAVISQEKLMENLQIPLSFPTTLYSDSKSAIGNQQSASTTIQFNMTG
uniref:Uncharacterized protein n=1 Tax=Rhizophora mucronata TaxID=61149 RepID=A0A2P2NJU6_RHIMU